MIVAMMQPTFMPWQGYFELIMKSDLFVILDDFQFSVQSYHQRNRLFIDKGTVGWFTVPVQKNISFKSPINQVMIQDTTSWRQKMWRRIEVNYGHCPFYSKYAKEIHGWLFNQSKSLFTLNLGFIQFICGALSLQENFIFSSDYPGDEVRSQRVLSLLRKVGAKKYRAARGAFGYMKKDGIFPVTDLKIEFQKYNPLPYHQYGSPYTFVPYLCILDALLNIGPEETKSLVASGTKHWSSWDEMARDYTGGNHDSA